jgi:chitinase
VFDYIIISFLYEWPSTSAIATLVCPHLLPLYSLTRVTNLDGCPQGGQSYNFPVLNLANHCGNTSIGDLLSCSDIGIQIAKCQSLGTKVMLSIGGGVSSFSFSTATPSQLANSVWNLFLGGTAAPYASYRPFGTDSCGNMVVLDGIDLDIETGQSSSWSAVASQLRILMNGDTERTYYMSGAV